jgi:YVTN family beta-propeller protein
MQSNRRKRSSAAWRGGFTVLCALSALGAALSARPAQAAPFAYVSTDSGISVIDTAINEVVAQVRTNGGSLAVTTDGKRVYAAGVNTISVIGTVTNTVVATINEPGITCCGPVAVAPDGKHAYVAASRPNALDIPADLVVLVLDTATETVVARITVDHAGEPGGIAVTRDGKHVYVGCVGKVVVLDTASSTVVATVSLPTPPPPLVSGLAITPDGKHAYVTDKSNNKVLVLDTATNTVVATVSFQFPVDSPSGVAITPDGKHAYVAAFGSMSVLDTASNTIVARVSLPTGLSNGGTGVAITPDGKHAYVTGGRSDRVSVLDTATNTVVDTLTLSSPGDVAIMPSASGVP